MTKRSRKGKSRIFWRERGGERRAYADLRDFADAGGSREALVAPGQTSATTDPVIAQHLLAERLRDLEARRRGRVLHGEEKVASLGELAALDLRAKWDSGKFTAAHLSAMEVRLRRVLAFLGGEKDPRAERVQPRSVTVAQMRALVAHLRQTPLTRNAAKGERVPLVKQDGTPRVLTDASVRHHLNALSSVYRRAASEGYVPPGFNPVGAMLEKPVARPKEARWLEVPDAARLLEAARTYATPVDGTPFGFPLIATFLLTGGRESEVYGLEIDDISLERKTVTFRPNAWRRLKTGGSARVIPLWPQLEEILRDYLRGPHRPAGELLFPSLAIGKEALLTDVRKMLDHVGKRADFAKGEIRTKMFRHTYCAARLQTLDGGAPVSIYTVSRELGHTSIAMVQKVYSHLGQVRHRREVVEYRPDAPRSAATQADLLRADGLP